MGLHVFIREGDVPAGIAVRHVDGATDFRFYLGGQAEAAFRACAKATVASAPGCVMAEETNLVRDPAEEFTDRLIVAHALDHTSRVVFTVETPDVPIHVAPEGATFDEVVAGLTKTGIPAKVWDATQSDWLRIGYRT